MDFAVVDTNVLLAADGHASHATIGCQATAADALEEIQYHGSLVLDEGRDILGEYGEALGKYQHQPGPGEDFFIWASGRGALLVRLNCHPLRGYEEFPDTVDLARFDWDDRKFVAATIKSGTDRTELVNAVDSDYMEHEQALRAAGVAVRELCREVLRPGAV